MGSRSYVRQDERSTGMRSRVSLAHTIGIDPMDADTNGLGEDPDRFAAIPDNDYATDDMRRMTEAEADAVLTLVRGGWLKFELGDWARG